MSTQITENMVRIGNLVQHNINWQGMTPTESIEDISRNLGISKETVIHCVKTLQSNG